MDKPVPRAAMTDPVFFQLPGPISVGEIATLVGAIMMDSSKAKRAITGLAAATEGGAGKLVFLEGRKNAGLAGGLKAAAVLCTEEVALSVDKDVAVLVSRSPQRDFAMIGRALYRDGAIPGPMTDETGISPAAHVAPDALVEKGAIIEAGAVIGSRAAIGRGTVIGPTAVIGRDCRIGRDCYIGPGASIIAALIGDRVIIHPGARIGQDGFGFVPGAKGLEKMPQLGRVVIQDDVEIGANTTIDRGALNDTIIGEGTKIDNLVQIAHNVKIGRSCAIAGKCGLSGSVELGDFVMLGGGVGVADHIKIGTGAQLAGGSGVMTDVPPAARWAGLPAQSMRDFFREVSTIRAMTKQKAIRKPGDE